MADKEFNLYPPHLQLSLQKQTEVKKVVTVGWLPIPLISPNRWSSTLCFVFQVQWLGVPFVSLEVEWRSTS